MNYTVAVVYFENEIENPSKWNTERGDDKLISLDLHWFGIHEKALKEKFVFESNNPNWYSFECEVTGDELLKLVGHNVEEAKQRENSFLSFMVQWRKEHDGEGYTQVLDIENFFKEVAQNSIEKVLLHLAEGS